LCTSTTIWGVGRPVAWFGLSCISDPAIELDREGLILLQVVNEDLVKSVKRDEIAASVPEEVATGGQEIDSRLGCSENSQHRESDSLEDRARKVAYKGIILVVVDGGTTHLE